MIDKKPIDYALAYAKLGWNVLPVWSVDDHGQCRCGRPNHEKGHKAGKHPQSDLVPHGHHDATTDEATIRDWWATDPDAGIGIELSTSGLLALDIDPQNGGDESLRALEAEHGVLHSDCTAVTQGGGEHRLFSADSTLSYPGTLGAGLDLKHHGYICVAPTSGPSGIYQWEAGRSPLSKSNPAQPSPLPALIASKARAPVDYSLTERGGVPVATAQTFDDLRSALEHVDFDDYTTWVNVGMVLKPYGENGYKVWTEWAARSDKFDASAQRRKWERDISAPHSITYRSIFRMAIDNGWKGNNKTTTTSSTEPKEKHPLAQFISFEDMVSKPREFVLDNIMVAGVVIVAGFHSAGKTSQLVPLMCHVAHLCGNDSPLHPTLRRRIIYIAEEPKQVFEILDGMKALNLIPTRTEEISNWFKVIKAERLQPEVIAKVASVYRRFGYINCHPTNGQTFEAMPVVVLDTANASIDVANESDNAEVGRAISVLKGAFGDIPIVIVAHTAKANRTQDRGAPLTARGASAWEADAHQVIYIKRDDSDRRVLDISTGKHRFSTPIQELEFATTSCTFVQAGILGDPQDATVVFGMPKLAKEALASKSPSDRSIFLKKVVVAAALQAMDKPTNEAKRSISRTKLINAAHALAKSTEYRTKVKRTEIDATIDELLKIDLLCLNQSSDRCQYFSVNLSHAVMKNKEELM